MAYRHVRDEPAPRGSPFSIWRCPHCNAMCVTKDNSQPPKKCGRCHQ